MQNQIATLKQRWDESEDRFNEASARCETLSAQVFQLEAQLKRNKKAHEESLGKIKESLDGSGDVQRMAQAQIDEYTHKLNIQRNEYHEVVTDLRRQLDRAQRDLEIAQGNRPAPEPVWAQRQQNRDAKRAAELQEQLRSQKDAYESRIDQLERELAEQKHSAQLASKERELEAIRVNYAQELDRRDERYNRLKALYEMDKQAWSSSNHIFSQTSGLAPSEDIVQLQKQVSMLTKQKDDYELHFQATMETYEARIKRIQQEASDRLAQSSEKIMALESARRTLDFDRSRFQGQVASLKRERTALETEVSRLRGMRSAYDELKAKYPALLKEFNELKDSHSVHMRNNATLETDREEYTAKVKVLESQIDEYIALLQAAQYHNGSGTDLADRYNLLKSTYSMDRQKYKRKIKKLERKLAQYGLESDNPSDRPSAPTHSASEEDETAGAAATGSVNGASHPFHENEVGPDLFEVSGAQPLGMSPRPQHEEPRGSTSAHPARRTKANIALQERLAALRGAHAEQFASYEEGKPAYRFPPTLRERKADTKVPRHKSRVYVRSEVRPSKRLVTVWSRIFLTATFNSCSATRPMFPTKWCPTLMTNFSSGNRRHMRR